MIVGLLVGMVEILERLEVGEFGVERLLMGGLVKLFEHLTRDSSLFSTIVTWVEGRRLERIVPM